MKKLWTFVSQPQNLAVLIALAGGIGFLWKEMLAPKPPPKVEAPAAIVQQATSNGGVAVNATGSAHVEVGNKPSAP